MSNIVRINQNEEVKGVTISDKTFDELKLLKKEEGITCYEVTREEALAIQEGEDVSIVDGKVILNKGSAYAEKQNTKNKNHNASIYKNIGDIVAIKHGKSEAGIIDTAEEDAKISEFKAKLM